MKVTWKKRVLAEAAMLDADEPGLGRELEIEDLKRMLVGTPFYVFTTVHGLQLRIKLRADDKELTCFSHTGRSCYHLKNMGETFVCFGAMLSPLSYKKGKDLFTVVYSRTGDPSPTIQNFTSRDMALNFCHTGAKTCAKLCGMSEHDLQMNCDGADFTSHAGHHYTWKIIENAAQ